MKIKSIVFWLLQAGNNLTSQTISGEDLEPGSGSVFLEVTPTISFFYVKCSIQRFRRCSWRQVRALYGESSTALALTSGPAVAKPRG